MQNACKITKKEFFVLTSIMIIGIVLMCKSDPETIINSFRITSPSVKFLL